LSHYLISQFSRKQKTITRKEGKKLNEITEQTSPKTKFRLDQKRRNLKKILRVNRPEEWILARSGPASKCSQSARSCLGLIIAVPIWALCQSRIEKAAWPRNEKTALPSPLGLTRLCCPSWSNSATHKSENQKQWLSHPCLKP
jgi:hypothetical protein